MLSINRMGTFDILPEQFCDAQCGMNTKVDYAYEVKIEATDKQLIEPEMFVVDNMAVKEYFDNRYVGERCQVRSCEVLASDAIKHFYGWFRGEGAIYPYIDVRRIYVVIRGSDHSFITGEWNSYGKEHKA